MTRRRHGLTLVAQYDHGALAGELAGRWGNERFAPAAAVLREPLRIAAAHHDDGWHELDDLPAYAAAAGRPAHFLELGVEETIPPYGRGVDRVYERDLLAGALVAMHWSGLYSGRWGLQGGGPARHPLARAVVAEQEARRQEALREVWGYEGLRSAFEADVWHAYEVLQALDLISLALSLLDPAEPGGGRDGALSLPATLAAIEQPVGARILPAVPTGPLGEHPDLLFGVPEPGLAVIDPWPFGPGSFALALPARILGDVVLGEAEAAAAFHAAPVTTVAWRLAESASG